MVAASGTLVLAGGIGASFGPSLAAGIMGLVGPAGFFAVLGLIHAAVGGFTVYRMSQRAGTPVVEQGPTIPVGTGAGALASRLSVETLRDHLDQHLAEMSRSGLRRR
jgi:hypothetical protein